MAKRASGEADGIDAAIGARLRIRRKELAISQSELAQRIGVSFQQVQKYERGSNRVSASMLVAIARVLDAPPSALLGGDQGSAVEAELLAMLAEDGAADLLRAFAHIPDRETRQAVLAIAQGLAVGPGRRTAERR